ncbi:hypothetical protein [Cohnella rhizosphaerae]|uniref:Uncharacterized protein n=1 Tax=Cohnella rhizosphaerae TaxID=1457232 RepID=A0A9X4KQV4_9BACL|nr:hypothetical protein [Cohnella rhizosphaerae]MDG0808868.1 hypothetical protein [Cohnella rhizosphaerae]
MTIHENESGWIVRAADRQLEIDTNTLVLTLTDTAAGRSWKTVRGEDHILLRTEEGERLVRLADAAVKTFEIRRSGYYEGVYATLSGFPRGGRRERRRAAAFVRSAVRAAVHANGRACVRAAPAGTRCGRHRAYRLARAVRVRGEKRRGAIRPCR